MLIIPSKPQKELSSGIIILDTVEEIQLTSLNWVKDILVICIVA